MLTQGKVAERKEQWADRWRIARLAAKCEKAGDLEALAEAESVAVNSLRNYAGVARQYKAKDVRGLIGRVPFTAFEILRGYDDRLDLLRQDGMDVAVARRIARERKGQKGASE